MSVTIDSVLVRDQGLAAADLDGQIVVLSVRSGAYIGLNEVGSEIWQILSEPRRVGDLFEALSQSHDVDAATLSRDVMPFLQDLIERGLVRQMEAEAMEAEAVP